MNDNAIEIIRGHLRESCNVKVETAAFPQAIAKLAEAIVKTLQSGHKLLIFGNGGSAADAQHFAAELVVKYQKPRRALAAIALTTDTSVLTACGNDFSFEEIFARQIEALGYFGDMAIGLSTSGESRNVVLGLHVARNRVLNTVLLTGNRDLPAHRWDHLIAVPSTVTAHIQETHIAIIHAICAYIDARLIRKVKVKQK